MKNIIYVSKDGTWSKNKKNDDDSKYIRLPYKNDNNKATRIMIHVCKKRNVSIEELESKTRQRNISTTRQIIAYIIKKTTKLTLSEIGQYCGGHPHDQVIYSLKVVANLIETDKKFKEEINSILKIFNK